MKKLIICFVFVLPVIAAAQKEAFLKEFDEVNDSFFAQPFAVLMQKYSYYEDISMTELVDSSFCTIVKNKTSVHYKISGMESFSDSGYSVKISHADNSIFVLKTPETNKEQLKAIFNAGFSVFKEFTKKIISEDLISWQMEGGDAGVNSALLIIDIKQHQIRSLQMNMAADHPLVMPFRKPGQEADPTVTIKIDYQYTVDATVQEVKKLGDFVVIGSGSVTPSENYKNYRIKLLTGKQ